MRRKVAHSNEERELFLSKGLAEVGREENGNYVFWSNKLQDVLSSQELKVFELRSLTTHEIAQKIGISEGSVLSYRKKIRGKGINV